MQELFNNTFLAREKNRSIALMLIGSLFISLGPFFVSYSLASAEANTFYRLVVGSLFFLLYSFLKKQFFIEKTFFFTCFFTGSLLVLDLYLWNQSVLYIGAGISTILANLEILFLIFFGSFFFAEKFPKHFTFHLCVILGSILALLFPLLSNFNNVTFAGISLALFASFSYALYLFAIKYISQKFPSASSTSMLAIICTGGATFLGIIMVIKNQELFFLHSSQSYYCIFLNAFFSQIIAWWCISKSIKKLSLSISGFLLLLQPALTFFLDTIFISQGSHWLQAIGSIFLLASVYTISKNQNQKEDHAATS